MFNPNEYDLNRQYRQDRMWEAEQQRRAASAAQPRRNTWTWFQSVRQALLTVFAPKTLRAPQRAPQTKNSYRQPVRSRS